MVSIGFRVNKVEQEIVPLIRVGNFYTTHKNDTNKQVMGLG
jgi:hypothetical protein